MGYGALTTRTLALGLIGLGIALVATGRAAAGKPQQPSRPVLSGANAWSGVRALRPKANLQILPDTPLKLEASPGGGATSGIVGDPAGTIRLQQWKGHVRGVVRSPRFGTYLIKQAPGQPATVLELDPDALVGCEAD